MSTMRRGSGWVMVAVAATLLTACGGEDEPTGSGSDEPAVATFQVVDETFKVELATPDLEEHARRLLAGEDELPQIPTGLVVHEDSGVNDPWSWHIDPNTLEFAFMTTEVCDGTPSLVEGGDVTSTQYCPWSAEIVDVQPS